MSKAPDANNRENIASFAVLMAERPFLNGLSAVPMPLCKSAKPYMQLVKLYVRENKV